MNAGNLDALRIELDLLSQASLALALFLILFGIAIGLRSSDFAAVARRPAPFVGGVVAQIIGLPLVTLLLVNILDPVPSVALGMLVVACCPGGATSNLFTHLARGDVALSVSLTATSSLIAALATPVSILFWSSLYPPTAELLNSLEFNAIRFLLQTLLLLAVPLTLGMWLAAKWPHLASWLAGPLITSGSICLIVAVFYGLYYFRTDLAPVISVIGGLVLLHNALAFSIGAIAGKVLTQEASAQRSLTFEVGIQNTGLALVILIAQLRGVGGAMAVAALWGIWHLIAGFSVVTLFRSLDRRKFNEMANK